MNEPCNPKLQPLQVRRNIAGDLEHEIFTDVAKLNSIRVLWVGELDGRGDCLELVRVTGSLIYETGEIEL
ncbi:hypothetical protein [Microtetraspora sp. NBRC 16547]|uniref:hypothetical protein n=1 Tax=Microtetraspora sp. NBRC 16547 TaxID=3030993 RepID=UPI0024A57E18|nr:hypothetical protein [Microtetraspora sp. NBRC 16547]GLW98198.1 hypothetical protein Misp02_22850 [Microtetraspora sp. NBRC 16547]